MPENTIQIRDIYIVDNSSQVDMDEGRPPSRNKVYLVMAITFLLASFVYLGQMLLRIAEYPYFYLENITVSGCEQTTPEEITSLLNLPMGARLMKLDLQNLHYQVLNHPWVESCLVTRRMPDTLLIQVVEAKPVAILDMDRKFLIDGKGTVLEKSGDLKMDGIPVIKYPVNKELILITGKIHDSLLQDTLSWINAMESDPGLWKKLKTIDMRDGKNIMFWFKGTPAPIIVGKRFDKGTMTRLLIFLDRVDMGNMNMNLKCVDLRFKNRVILKPVKVIRG